MSSKGFKRPLEPDSVLAVQPVSKSDDDLTSPECLLSLQPAGDDYSSANDSDKARKKVGHQAKERRYPRSKPTKGKKAKKIPPRPKVDPVGLRELIDGLHINFSSSQPTQTPPGESDTNYVLTLLLSFLSQEPITASEAIESVLNLDVCNPVIKWLNHYKTYNFPETYEGCEVHLQKEFLCIKDSVDGLLEDIRRAQHRISSTQINEDSSGIKHSSLTGFYAEFFRCSGEYLRYGGEVMSLTLRRLEDQIYSFSSHCCVYDVSSKPDLVIGNMCVTPGPVIPVEIYSAQKYQHLTSHNESSLEEPSLSSNSATSDQCAIFAEVEQILNVNYLACDNTSAAGGDGYVGSRCIEKLTEQLVVQVLGSAHKYIRSRLFPREGETPMYRKRQTFLGFFAFHFNLYIVKLEGFNEDILNICANNPTWQADYRGKHPLNVSFFPTALDVRKLSNGLALLFFITYYRRFVKH